MKDLVPGVGDRKASRRLDELFSRETLGAVLFGAAASKVVEKFNTLIVLIGIFVILDLKPTTEMWAMGFLLCFVWASELVLFTYLYIKWEEALKVIDDKANQAKEKASETAEKAKEKADEAKDKAKGDSDSDENSSGE